MFFHKFRHKETQQNGNGVSNQIGVEQVAEVLARDETLAKRVANLVAERLFAQFMDALKASAASKESKSAVTPGTSVGYTRSHCTSQTSTNPPTL